MARVTVADLAATVTDETRAEAEVVCLVFVRLPEGGYLYASAQQITWPDVMTVLGRRGALPVHATDGKVAR